MIDILTTIIEDSAFVEMPVWSVNSHSHWSSCNHIFDFLTSMSLSNSKRSIFSSLKQTFISCFGCVRILTLNGLSKIFNIFQSSDRITTITALIFIRADTWAINKLLLTQINRIWLIFELDLITLVSSSCSKCPTRAAWSLVFYLCYKTFISPVNFSSESYIDRLIKFFNFKRHFPQI